MKRYITILFFTILTVVIISALLFSKSSEELLSRFPIFTDLYKNTSLTISTRNGVSKVKIDGKDYGTTPLEIESLEEGQHEIELEREVEENTLFYNKQKFFLDVYRNTEAIIDMEIGPNNFLSGYVLYYSPSPKAGSDSGYLTVSSSPENSSVSLNGEYYKTTPIEVVPIETGEYKIKVSKDGYESIEVPIIIRDGFNLNVNVELFPIPVNL